MPDTGEEKLRSLDWILLSVVISVLVLTGWMLQANLKAQNATYDRVIDTALSYSARDSSKFNESNVAIFEFSRAKDFANTKAASLFIGFLLIFTGALYLLKVFKLSYKLKADKTPVGNVSFESTSPGLVMITLGVALMIAALVTKTQIDYSVENDKLKEQLVKVSKALESYQSSLAVDTTHQKDKDQKHKPPKSPPHKTNAPVVNTGNSFLTLATPSALADQPTKEYAAALVKWLKEHPNEKVYLTGQSTGTNTAQQLQKARDLANGLKGLLIELGASSQQIKVTSYGESPAAALSTWKNGVQIRLE